MKILIVSHEYPPIGGGGANACYFLIKEYVAKGHEVTLLTACFQGNALEENSKGIHIVRVNAQRKKQEKSNLVEMLIFLKNALEKIGTLQKQEQFDICQVFFGIPSGPIGLYLKKIYKVPYVIRFGGGDIPGAQKRYTIIYKLLSPILRYIWKNADGLVANSEGLQRRAENFEKRYPIICIGNGVDINFFHPKERKGIAVATEIRVLFVSRLIEGKGLQDVIPNMKEINERVGKRVVLQIVGDGPYRIKLERLAKDTHVESYVQFEGRKTKQELLQYYQNADLFILPSRSEGMPNVVLEAMAMGLPIIMTPCEGSKELISDNGYIATIGQFAEYIIKVCRDGKLREQLGNYSILAVQREFTWENKADQYLALMTACLTED